MAQQTSKALRNMVMYQVFVRNFSAEGTFEKVRERLGDIKALGTDVIWLMPIHPVGKAQRKGTLGSPYAISDYRAVNPEFGKLDDFKALVEDIHAHGMKCIIDVVYNHTSPDSVLCKEHPEWFYHKEDGSFGNRVGDWTDIIDLDYSNKELWSYQIETLRMWAEIVDGFRCDVAPLIPLEFWLEARKAVEEVRSGCIWLSESVEPGFITYMRGRGLTALSDSEIYQAFDMCYDYDVYGKFRAYLSGKGTLEEYAEAVNRQEYIYPENYVKLRFLENHDQTRAAFLIPDRLSLANWTAFNYFQKGLTLIYAGQEYGAEHLPSLFDKDDIFTDDENDIRMKAQSYAISVVPDGDGVTATAVKKEHAAPELLPLMRVLAKIKRDPLFKDSVYTVKAQEDRFLIASHEKDGRKALGVFTVKDGAGYVEVDFPDGVYTNLINDKPVEVFRGGVQSLGLPIILIK
ncbi:MAG: alpha-amylase [Ruminococcus sp.]|nr:alpha-amylase [Ruminococcus sp.]